MEKIQFCDLHLHLGAAVTPHFLWELAHEQGINLREKNYWRFIDSLKVNKTTSNQYLRKLDSKNHSPFVLSQKIQSSPQAIERCIHYVISRQYRKFHVTKIEIRFNPILRNREGEYDLDKIILAAIVGIQRAMIDYPVKAGLILETDRQFSFEKHKIIFEKAVKYRDLGVVAVDVSGPNPPQGFSIEPLIELFHFAKKNGLKTTFHTGEFSPIEEVWQVVEKISPHRLGHGVIACWDRDLIRLIKKKRIILEICPTSNIKTQVVPSWSQLSQIIKIFLKAGVRFTINSDGPEFFATSVKEEFQTLIKNRILTQSQAEVIRSFAFMASFV